jgi:hypothetical protein
MTAGKTIPLTSEELRTALSQWDDIDAAAALRAVEAAHSPELSNVELVHLRVRVIALENLVIALIAQGPDQLIDVTRKMASYITPRPSFTQHPLTIQAASKMIDSIDRAIRFRKLSGI